MVSGIRIPNDDFPRHLGVKLDRTLAIKQHLETLKDKLKTRNNIISKLARTSWGCKANTLRTSALALVYSAAEYFAPTWSRSVHRKKINTQMNHTMRLNSSTVKSTQTQWSSFLEHIAPPNLRRKAATCSLLLKIKGNLNLSAHLDIFNHPAKILKSRNPRVWESLDTELDLENQWLLQWTEATVNNLLLMKDLTKKLPSFGFLGTIWITTNGIRTEQCRFNYLFRKWGMTESPFCDFRELQIIRHIVESCTQRKYATGMLGIP